MRAIDRSREMLEQVEGELSLRRATLQFVGGEEWGAFCTAMAPVVEKHASALLTKELDDFMRGRAQGYYLALSALTKARADVEKRVVILEGEAATLRKTIKRLQDRDDALGYPEA